MNTRKEILERLAEKFPDNAYEIQVDLGGLLYYQLALIETLVNKNEAKKL